MQECLIIILPRHRQLKILRRFSMIDKQGVENETDCRMGK